MNKKIPNPLKEKTISNFTFLFSFRILDKIFSLLALFFIMKKIEPTVYGEYVFYLSLVSICSLFALPGISHVISNHAAKNDGSILWQASLKSFKHSLWGTIGLLGIAIIFKLKNDSSNISSAILASCILPLYHGFFNWRSLLSGKGEFRKLALIETCLNMFTFGGLIIYSQIFQMSSFGMLMISLGVPSVFNLVFTSLHYQRDRISCADIEASKKISFYSAFSLIGIHLDKLLIPLFLSTEMLAFFYFAEKISEFFKGAIQDIGGVLTPMFVKADSYEEIEDKLLKISIVFGVGVVLFAFGILPFLLEKFFQQFKDSIFIAQLLLITVSISVMQGLRFRYLLSQKHLKGIKHVQLYSTLARVVTSCLFIPILGIWGAVLSVFAYRVFTGILVRNIIQKISKSPA